MNCQNTDLLRVQPASLVDQTAGLRLVFAHLPPADRERIVTQVLADSGETPVAGLWVGYRGEPLAAAMLAQIQPGRTAVLSSPRVAPDQPSQTAHELLAQVMADLPNQGVQMVQTLLETDQGPDVDLLVEHGFRHVSNLLYLVSLTASFPTSCPSDGLEFVAYAPEDHQRLAGLLRRTYSGSLDCPEIDGIRNVEDVLTGYQAIGEFDPARWIFARRHGTDIGCVLLTDHPQSRQWELIYMGVVPEARGQAHGVAIARYAQWLARQAGRERLVLAVDANNEPAIAMYAAAGFVVWDHRSVFLRVF
jgi:mycothiol synthase